ncbi:hypothetical protein [Luteolibacter sp. AS25]|uniref:hypothetical protein n=1 Tax=Luteolibacter sp. AS25 TaxID=3135776 RepID=UPI00398B6D41
MKTKPKALKIAAGVLLMLVLIGLYGIIFLARPLLPSDDYDVTATIDGSTVEAKLLKAFPFGSYYIHIDTKSPGQLNWFGVAFGRKSVFSPVGIYTSKLGFIYMHADQDKGVVLTDGKIEDNWTVDFTATGTTFQNSSTAVTLKK